MTKSKGKSIGCGGYGLPHTTINVDEKGSSSVTHDYLFVEEALFLHERGLLQVYNGPDDCNKSTANKEQEQQDEEVQDNHKNNSTCPTGNIMTTRDIYHLMLNELNMSLAVYLTYSHLRSQTFIVLRHTSQRIDILRRLGQYMQSGNGHDEKKIKRKRRFDSQKGDCKDDDTYKEEGQQNDLLNDKDEAKNDSSISQDKKTLAMLKKELRDDSFMAPSPQLVTCQNSCPSDKILQRPNEYSTIQQDVNDFIAFHVYNPNSNFKKTMPGMPDYLVSIVPFSETTDFFLLQSIVEYCGTIPLKIAVVSESGTVSMFGISNLGVPSISSSCVGRS